MRQRLKITVSVLCLSLAALVFCTVLLAKQASLVREATYLEARSNEWQARMQQVLSSLSDAETAQRGYLLTGKARYLAPYLAARNHLPEKLTSLDQIAKLDPRLSGRIGDLRKQASVKLGELADTIHLYDSGHRLAAIALVQTDAGQAHMERLRADIDSIAGELRTRTDAYSQRVQSRSAETERLAIIAVSLLILTVCIAGAQIAMLMTAHARFERRVESSERFVRAITDNVPVRLAYFDTAERFQFVNQVLCSRFARPRDEFINHTLAELVPGGADIPISRRLPAALAGETQRFEYTDMGEGVPREIETQLIPDMDGDGRVRGVFGIGVDITHRVTIERSLRDLTEVFDNTTDYVAQADHRGQLLYLNPSARRALGLPPSAPVQAHISELFTAETNDRWTSEIRPAVETRGVWIGETGIILCGGRIVPVNHMVIAHRGAHGGVARYSSILRDISTEVAARHELARQTATLNAVIESMPAMIAVWDRDLRYRLVNSALERWRGTCRDHIVGRTIEEVVGPDEYRRRLPWIQRALAGEVVEHEEEYAQSGRYRYVTATYVPLRLDDGSIGGFLGVAQDITPHREENLRLLTLSERDPLTGLLNRAGFEAYLSQKTSHGEGAGLAALYIDLDYFKPVNDTYGHAAGDRVLKEFADRLLTLVRPTDAVARVGGDEFAVVLAGVRDPEHAALVADKIVSMASRPIRLADSTVTVTIGASVGVACDANNSGGWRELIARADKMAYDAKQAGRGRRALEALSASDSHTPSLTVATSLRLRSLNLDPEANVSG